MNKVLYLFNIFILAQSFKSFVKSSENNYNTDNGLKAVDFGDEFDYDIDDEKSNLLEKYMEVLQNSEAVDVLYDALQTAFDEGSASMEIPQEIDPKSRKVLVEDAEETLINYIEEQISFLGSVLDEMKDVAKKSLNDTEDKMINLNRNLVEFIKVLDTIEKHYSTMWVYLKEEQNFAYDYEDQDQRDDTVIHYLGGIQSSDTPIQNENQEKENYTKFNDEYVQYQKQLFPFSMSVGLILMFFLFSVFVIAYFLTSKKCLSSHVYVAV